MKIKNELEMTNLIFDISNKKEPQLKYSKSTRNDFKRFIDANEFESLANLIINNKINLDDVLGIHTSTLKMYSSNGIEYRGLNEYKELLKKIQSTNKDLLVGIINSTYKSKTRQQGTLFRDIVFQLKENLEKKFTFVEDLDNIDLNSNFIFLPKKDIEIRLLLLKYPSLKKFDFGKDRDILIKHNNDFFIGEAKQIHESGGAQNHQLIDMENCSKINFSSPDGFGVYGFGIIYGASLSYDNKYKNALLNNDKIVSLMDFLNDDTIVSNSQI